jgi:hypothetical protein
VSNIGFRCANCGHDHSLEEIRRGLYLSQRSLGDLQAARRGTLGKRLARRYVTRTLMRSLFR